MLIKPWFSLKRNKKRHIRNKTSDSSKLISVQKTIIFVYCQLCLFFFFSCWTDNFYSIHKEDDRWSSSWAAAGIWPPVAYCWWLRTSLHSGEEHSGVHLSGELWKLAAQSQVFSCAIAPMIQKKPKKLGGLHLSLIISKILICQVSLLNQKRLYCLWMVWHKRKHVENAPQPQDSH